MTGHSVDANYRVEKDRAIMTVKWKNIDPKALLLKIVFC